MENLNETFTITSNPDYYGELPEGVDDNEYCSKWAENIKEVLELEFPDVEFQIENCIPNNDDFEIQNRKDEIWAGLAPDINE